MVKKKEKIWQKSIGKYKIIIVQALDELVVVAPPTNRSLAVFMPYAYIENLIQINASGVVSVENELSSISIVISSFNGNSLGLSSIFWADEKTNFQRKSQFM